MMEMVINARKSSELASEGRELKKAAKLLHKIEKAYETPTMWKFYRAMKAYSEIEFSARSKRGEIYLETAHAVLPEAKEQMRKAFEERLPALEEKAEKTGARVMFGFYFAAMATAATAWIVGFQALPLVAPLLFAGSIGGRRIRSVIAKTIGNFKEKILGEEKEAPVDAS